MDALGVARARRELSWRRWGLPGAALDISGASQGTLLASLGRRRGHFGRRWGLAEAALGVAGVFQETLWVPRSLEEAGLVVAGASQETLWASRGPQECLTSIQSSISLQCLFWVSMLSFTSVLHLGLDAFLHFKSFFGWVSDWAFSIDARGRDLSVSTCTGWFRCQNRWCPMEECLRSTASRMWCHHVIGRDGWEWGDQGA